MRSLVVLALALALGPVAYAQSARDVYAEQMRQATQARIAQAQARIAEQAAWAAIQQARTAAEANTLARRSALLQLANPPRHQYIQDAPAPRRMDAIDELLQQQRERPVVYYRIVE